MKPQDSGPPGPVADPDATDATDAARPGALPLGRRRERFCRAYAGHGNAAAAARAAGYARASARQRGHKLLKAADVQARVAEIKAALAAEAADDPRRLLAKLEAVYLRALASRHFNAAARAVELQARLGRRPRARPDPGPEPGSDQRCTEKELDAMIADAEAALGGDGDRGAAAADDPLLR